MEIFQTVIVVAVIIVVALIITGVVKAACRIRKGRITNEVAGGRPIATSGVVLAGNGPSQTALDQPPSYVEACPTSCIVLLPPSGVLLAPPSYDALASTSHFLPASGYAQYPPQPQQTLSAQLLAGGVMANRDRREPPPGGGSASAAITADGAVVLMGRPSSFIFSLSATTEELLPSYESVAVSSSRPLYAWI